MEKKIYEKKSEKVIDFLIGFFLIPTFFGITIGFVLKAAEYYYKTIPNFCWSWILTFVLLAELNEVISLYRKRKFIGIGLLFALVVVPLVLLGTCLLIMGGVSIFGHLFKR